MRERLLLLERNIEQDLETIEGLLALLAAYELDESEPQERLIVLGYRLFLALVKALE